MDQPQLRSLLRDRFPTQRTYLLPALHLVQDELGHLPDWALQVVGWHLRIPASEVYGSATSYSELRIPAPPVHIVRVCTGAACRSEGGKELLEGLTAHLGNRPADAASEIAVEETACGFICPMAPAAQIDGRWLGRLTRAGLFASVDSLNGQGKP
ncbi:MAG: hypothetical protein BZY88_06520 [SAR202 cluster bacterium Io17-Chloro-G9]|nr:MAG: hypothetical protein BZY88_06520 [SAR202 cluster bacterium Io17-Chloro-G9]